MLVVPRGVAESYKSEGNQAGMQLDGTCQKIRGASVDRLA